MRQLRRSRWCEPCPAGRNDRQGASRPSRSRRTIALQSSWEFGKAGVAEAESVQRYFGNDCDHNSVGHSYETPVDLRDREIQLRYDRRRGDTSPVVVYHKGNRMGSARLLDAVANGLRRRKEQP